MATADFKVMFDGQMIQGADPAKVRGNIAKLFQMDVDKVEPLFSGRRVVLKRDLNEATAEKYRAAFKKAGAIATIVGPDDEVISPPGKTTATPPAPQPALAETPTPSSPEDSRTVPEPPAAQSGEPAETPTRLDIAEASRAAPPAATRGTPTAPDDMTIAEPGADLVDAPRNVEAPTIDTSHLTLAEPGVDLAEPKKVLTPEHDLSAYELSPPGTKLGDSR